MRIPDYPKLHFLIRTSEQNGYDVCSYTPSYPQEFLDRQTGEVTYGDKMEPIDVKVVGHVVHRQQSGRIVFDEEFLQLYPALRYYRAYCRHQTIEFEPVEEDLAEIIYQSELEREAAQSGQKLLQSAEPAAPEKTEAAEAAESAAKESVNEAGAGAEFRAEAETEAASGSEAEASSEAVPEADFIATDINDINKLRQELAQDYQGKNIELLSSAQVSALQRLKEIRKQIDAYDEAIAQALEPRLNLINEALKVKALLGEGVVSALREQDVLDHGLELEQKFNLPASLMQDIQRRILRCSYEGSGTSLFTQASKAKELSGASETIGQVQESPKVVIVGGAGGMGSFMRRFLERANYAVSIVEPDDYKYDAANFQVSDIKLSRAAERLRQAQWCIVSVPIAVTLETIEKIAPLLPAKCVLSDLTSVKEAPVKCMLKAHKGPVLGLHPMFGPDTHSMVKQVVVAVPARDKKNCAFILDQLKLFGAQVVICDAAEHDVAMRVIQALRHFTTVAYGNFLRALCTQMTAPNGSPKVKAAGGSEEGANTVAEVLSQPEGQNKKKATKATKVSKSAKAEESQAAFLEKLLQLSSPIYHLELMMVGRLFAQDPHLYCDIISASSENLELIQSYVHSAQDCLDLLLNQNKDEFVQQFAQTKQFFGKSASDFLQESSDILALVQDTYPVKD